MKKVFIIANTDYSFLMDKIATVLNDLTGCMIATQDYYPENTEDDNIAQDYRNITWADTVYVLKFTRNLDERTRCLIAYANILEKEVKIV